VHAIKTDDPDGIERYWLKRFERKRKNREWFQLSGDDTKTFRNKSIMCVYSNQSLEPNR